MGIKAGNRQREKYCLRCSAVCLQDKQPWPMQRHTQRSALHWLRGSVPIVRHWSSAPCMGLTIDWQQAATNKARPCADHLLVQQAAVQELVHKQRVLHTVVLRRTFCAVWRCRHTACSCVWRRGLQPAGAWCSHAGVPVACGGLWQCKTATASATGTHGWQPLCRSRAQRHALGQCLLCGLGTGAGCAGAAYCCMQEAALVIARELSSLHLPEADGTGLGPAPAHTTRNHAYRMVQVPCIHMCRRGGGLETRRKCLSCLGFMRITHHARANRAFRTLPWWCLHRRRSWRGHCRQALCRCRCNRKSPFHRCLWQHPAPAPRACCA